MTKQGSVTKSKVVQFDTIFRQLRGNDSLVWLESCATRVLCTRISVRNLECYLEQCLTLNLNICLYALAKMAYMTWKNNGLQWQLLWSNHVSGMNTHRVIIQGKRNVMISIAAGTDRLIQTQGSTCSKIANAIWELETEKPSSASPTLSYKIMMSKSILSGMGSEKEIQREWKLNFTLISTSRTNLVDVSSPHTTIYNYQGSIMVKSWSSSNCVLLL